ncbi:MAG: VC0807 family protein [Acidimicrobiales bacterium]
MHTISVAQPVSEPTEGAPAVAALTSPERGRVVPLAKIAMFDIAGPLVTYSLLRSAGMSAVGALILSGAFPAFGVLLGVARDRRVEVFGVLVLVGIAVGTVLGLTSGSARLVLLEGSVPTAVFGAVCIGSLWTARPLMFRFAIEFMGADTPMGRDFADNWRYIGFRHAFRVTTVVWGVAYLAEAIARVFIVESTSTGNALVLSKAMPYAVAGVLAVWNVAYARRSRRAGERLGVAAHARGEVPPPMPS